VKIRGVSIDMNESRLFDVFIVGGGPAGLTAAITAPEMVCVLLLHLRIFLVAR